jgi:predicted nucleotidyltransferase
VQAEIEKCPGGVEEIELCLISQSVIRTLLYFDIFHYPITLDELYEYCNGYPSTKKEIEKRLLTLENLGFISRKGVFYYIKTHNMSALVENRVRGNKEAEKLLKLSRSFSKFISCFPFVKGICLSGSLSKGYADKQSDIDYFIVTEPGRLWIARTLLILFKKLFLFNSKKYFCVNYFVDTNSLEIPDKNLFVATELVSILPAANQELYQRLRCANLWVRQYLPNNTLRVNKYDTLPENRNLLKRLIEKLFEDKFGDKVDDFFFRLTLSTWKKKFKHFNPDEFDLKMRTRKNVSKHHPNGFQSKIMKQFEESIKKYEKQFEVNLG